LGFTALLLGSIIAGPDHYREMGAFWEAGWAASHHQDPYGIYPLTPGSKLALPGGSEAIVYDRNISPPSVLPLFQVFALFSPLTVAVTWTIFSALLIITGAGLVVSALGERLQKRQILWLLLSVSIFESLAVIEDYSLLFFLACLTLHLLVRGRTIWPAIIVGVLVAIKPNLGLWPIMLFLSCHKKAAVVIAGTAVTLSILPIFAYGPSIYWQWLHGDNTSYHSILVGDISLMGICSRLGSRTVGFVLAVISGFGFLLFVRRVRPSTVEISGLAICAGILCSPLGWASYTLFAAPFFIGFRRWGKIETTAAILLAIPQPLWQPTVGWVSLLRALPRILGLLLMITSFLRSSLQGNSNHDYSISVIRTTAA
jgi:Protein of unknown function (DUF2029).